MDILWAPLIENNMSTSISHYWGSGRHINDLIKCSLSYILFHSCLNLMIVKETYNNIKV